jgi:hypothetical protein
LVIRANIVTVMTNTKTARHNSISKEPNYLMRRVIAGAGLGSAAVLAVFGGEQAIQTIGAGADAVAGIVQNGNAPHGREIPRHNVEVINAHSVRGGTFTRVEGNTPTPHLDATIRYEAFEFGAGKNNVKAATDTLVPDEDIDEAKDAYATYLPDADRESYTVRPTERIVVAIDTDTNKIIPANELTPGQRQDAKYIEGAESLDNVMVSATSSE